MVFSALKVSEEQIMLAEIFPVAIFGIDVTKVQ